MAGASGNGTPAAVVAEGLSKHYRLGEHRSLQRTVNQVLRRGGPSKPPLEALAGINFKVFRGESFGIVGTNGSGKSTVLQILAGTTLPTGGRMVVRGRVLPLLAVGSGFHGELTGRENVRLFGSSLGVPREAIAERMEAIGAFAGIEGHMDTPVKRYSSGMVSRLSFSIAMQFPADIYIFDEVLAVVDGEFRERCICEIKGLHERGRTVIFVSHDARQVEELCSRTMWLERGRVRDTGPSHKVLEQYSHASAAGG